MQALVRIPPDNTNLVAEVEELDLGAVSFYDLAEHFASRPDFALLDTRTGQDGWDRFSFFAFAPFARLSAKSGVATVRFGGRDTQCTADLFDVLQSLLDRYRVERTPLASSVPFVGGALGYIAYEAGRSIEVLPENAVDDLDLPHCYFCFYNFAVALDHRTGRLLLCHFELPGTPNGMSAGALRAELRHAAAGAYARRTPCAAAHAAAAAIVPEVTEATYVEAVRRIREYIFAGDVYQVNLTQRFRADIGDASAWQVYKRLCDVNPAPFAAYLNCDGHAVVSSSPELFLRVRDTYVETRPIKGTIRRGATAEQDAQHRAALLSSAKNRAELAMIVDLLRNDLGRVCRPGTVAVRAFPHLETYPSVHHLVATIVAELEADRTLADLLRATFPGGSITGAPKIRAMEIIDELEPVTRGVYTGGIGYLTFDGRADLNIAIRTLVVKGRAAYVHAGGGVVADSDEHDEYEESLLKAEKLFEATTQCGLKEPL